MFVEFDVSGVTANEKVRYIINVNEIVLVEETDTGTNIHTKSPMKGTILIQHHTERVEFRVKFDAAVRKINGE